MRLIYISNISTPISISHKPQREPCIYSSSTKINLICVTKNYLALTSNTHIFAKSETYKLIDESNKNFYQYVSNKYA